MQNTFSLLYNILRKRGSTLRGENVAISLFYVLFINCIYQN